MMDFNGPYTLTIGGKPHAAASELEVINPASGEHIRPLSGAGAAELEAAVAAARSRLPGLAGAGIRGPRRLYRAAGRAFKENVEPLARLLTREQGKPISSPARKSAGPAPSPSA